MGAFHWTKNSGLNFRNFRMSNRMESISHQAGPISSYSRLSLFPTKNYSTKRIQNKIFLFLAGECANRVNRPTGNWERPVYNFPENHILTFFVENRQSRTGSNCGRSFCIQCSVDSKDSPPSSSFSRLKELGLIHTE